VKLCNLTLAQILPRIENRLDRGNPIRGNVALARRPFGEPDKVIVGHFASSADVQPLEQTYEELRLLRVFLTVDELTQRLRSAAESGWFDLTPDRRVELANNGSLAILPSEAPETGIGPRYLLEMPVAHKGEHTGAGPLVRFGQPSFATVDHAVRAWMKPWPFSGHSDGARGNLLFELPSSGPRFGELKLVAEGKLRVVVENLPAALKVELTGVWESEDSKELESFAQIVASEPIYRARPAWAQRLSLWLTTEDSEVQDIFFETPYHCARKQRVLNLSESRSNDEAAILREIHHGENERVEFKPFLRLEHEKCEELIATVIAFANMSGGAIYLGVSDHLEVKGIEHELRLSAPKDTRHSLEACQIWYCGALRKRITDVVSAGVEFQCETMSISGHTVIRVSVADSRNKPCRDLRSNEIWVRRGASTVRPAPDELDQLRKARSPLFDTGLMS